MRVYSWQTSQPEGGMLICKSSTATLSKMKPEMCSILGSKSSLPSDGYQSLKRNAAFLYHSGVLWLAIQPVFFLSRVLLDRRAIMSHDKTKSEIAVGDCSVSCRLIGAGVKMVVCRPLSHI